MRQSQNMKTGRLAGGLPAGEKELPQHIMAVSKDLEESLLEDPYAQLTDYFGEDFMAQARSEYLMAGCDLDPIESAHQHELELSVKKPTETSLKPAPEAKEKKEQLLDSLTRELDKLDRLQKKESLRSKLQIFDIRYDF